ncbi:Cytochrome P450 9e2 [Trachymyrmex zeteki]|uniref:Cytochrome P450 9e2 n=1 Tax=Mycetomoellerius zeteki TaxID=64791 RepID=A0A151XJK5_9HYME|nr:Cytochrome P450 9e2 [Trachymyrmex zeteki]
MTSVCAMEYWSILLSIVIGVISIHYLFKNFNFFKRNGIIHVPPIPLFGSAMPVLFRRMSFVDFILKIYNFNPNAKYYGLYFTTNPVFLLRDLELIKTVLVKNFEAFPDRRGFADINDTLFKKNLNGIIHVPPIPLFGSAMPILFRRMSFVDFILKIYNFNPNAKYYGLYFTTTPIFLLRDLELIKTVLVKNFEAFPDRRGFADTNDTLFKKNLFSLRGEKWRNVRNLLSPSFTSSKMKIMFTLMSECAVDFVKFLSTSQADKGDINMKDVCSKYTNDVIATCAFGIKINSMKDPTNKFYIYGKEASNFRGIVRSLKFFFIGTFPRLGRILNLKIMNDNVSDFFKDIINTTIMTRDAEHITRPDMLQLMMDIRGKEGRRELDIDDMTAQAFIFFLGGFDTSSTAISTAMCFAAHEIAANPEIQTKLQQEIDKVLEESNGEVSYEVINRLEYLDAVISEALRLYPPATVLERVCEKTFELPSTLPDEKPFIVKKGMLVWIPVLAIHHDEKYYDNPKKFDPERFLNNKMNNSSNYMPFGLGPRMCIANRFAMLEVKVLLFHLLARCELEPSTKTTSPIKFCKDFILMPENGFWLNIQRRKDIHPVLESKGMDS